jgi:CheY-like chemotaxis protein/HPt (histidine-containing phosphotransfer) domain-containing protein
MTHAADPPEPDGPTSPRGLRVLLVEDNEVNQQLAVRLLRRRGHAVTVSADGRDAVDLFAAQPGAFDLVLMDVQMPRLDGFAATASIRKLERDAPRRTPIVAMTAHAMQGDRERCLAAGMDGYVSKPIEVGELLEAIDAAVGTAGPAPEASAPPVASGATETLDWDRALEKVGGDETLLRELASIFLDAAPAMLAEVTAAAERGDAPALERAAHRLKGSVGNFAATEAFDAADRLERAGASGDLGEVADLLAALETALDEARAALRARTAGGAR